MIAVAVSGGVDSLCALLMLKAEGLELIALHGLFAPGKCVPSGLARVCAQAGVRLEIADLRAMFAEKVIKRFSNFSASGLTPNPCAICNREIKFGALMDAAMRLGADCLATGHYAAIQKGAGGAMLAPAKDGAKDQGYFLSLVSGRRLERAVFPLGGQTKAETRSLVRSFGFEPPLRKESQDACFLAAGRPLQGSPGPVLLRLPAQRGARLEELPRIGSHTGAVGATIGQRRGLRLPYSEPLYVREIDVKTNSIVAAPRSLLDIAACEAEAVNYFSIPESWPRRLFVRLRHRQTLCPAHVDTAGGALLIKLLEPRFATAPGQIAAVYDAAGRILAGAVVRSVIFAE